MIDTHIHFWRYQPEEYGWISDEMPTLKQDRLLSDVAIQAEAVGVTGLIGIQARCTESENDFLLSLAQDSVDVKGITINIIGIVGWLDFTAKDITEKLQHYRQEYLLKGFRHLVQDEPNPSEYWRYQVFRTGVKAALQQGFRYDLLCHQKDLAAVVDFAKYCDDNWLILDHLAKPDLKNADGFDFWYSQMCELAHLKHVTVKVSGLVTEFGKGCTAKDLQRYVLTAIELFGVERVLWGSDWPVSLLSGHDYISWANIWRDLIQSFTDNERTQMEVVNAKIIYGLD